MFSDKDSFGVTLASEYGQLCYAHKVILATTGYVFKTRIGDILSIPDHPDGVKKSGKHFLITPMVPRILKRYHMYGHNDKNTTKQYI